MHRPRRPIDAPLLPRGRADATRQVLLFAAAYLLYLAVRGVADGGGAGRAIWNATRIIDLERGLHVFVEPAAQAWSLRLPWLMDIADCTYVDAHTLVTLGALVYLYLRRNESFYFVRNMFMVGMALALVGYALYPTAPPRLMPAWGFADPVRRLTGITAERGPGSVLVNAYAAVPSMHVCFALMIAWPMSRLVRHRLAALAWRLYALAIVFVVLATGNHYLTDILLGALTAGLSALAATHVLARARPDVWAFPRPRGRGVIRWPTAPGTASLPDSPPVP